MDWNLSHLMKHALKTKCQPNVMKPRGYENCVYKPRSIVGYKVIQVGSDGLRMTIIFFIFTGGNPSLKFFQQHFCVIKGKGHSKNPKNMLKQSAVSLQNLCRYTDCRTG